ncbi:MAG: hypothetical protein ACOCW6_02950 [Spirochaetota bacterium]
MAESTEALRVNYRETLSQGGIESLRLAFERDLPDTKNSNEIFADLREQSEDDDLADLAAELVQTVNAGCSADDFHNWDYDHLESIIDLSNKHGFTIPRNLLNGLPEQLIILVDAKKLGEAGCDD